MVAITKECQGDVLQMLARAVGPIVEGIFHRNIDASIRFGIDTARREDIVRHPKGAPELVNLLSHTLTPNPEDTEI